MVRRRRSNRPRKLSGKRTAATRDSGKRLPFVSAQPTEGVNPTRRAASGADHILDQVELFETVEQAVADCTLLFATTARAHDQAKPVVAPQAAASEITAPTDKISSIS